VDSAFGTFHFDKQPETSVPLMTYQHINIYILYRGSSKFNAYQILYIHAIIYNHKVNMMHSLDSRKYWGSVRKKTWEKGRYQLIVQHTELWK